MKIALAQNCQTAAVKLAWKFILDNTRELPNSGVPENLGGTQGAGKGGENQGGFRIFTILKFDCYLYYLYLSSYPCYINI